MRSPYMRIVFVCLGNICRSPLAEGVMRHLVSAAGLSDRVSIDSAGTGAWHAGEPPDPRSVEAASRHGVSLEGQRARQVADSDYTDADWLLAMDASNLATLTRRAPTRAVRARVELLNGAPRGAREDVPDPYYGGDEGFEQVYAMVLRACERLLVQVQEEVAP